LFADIRDVIDVMALVFLHKPVTAAIKLLAIPYLVRVGLYVVLLE
jgi:hypothetical protein